MKKCSSCAKDLPDSALHCVFCGAKQAPAAVPGAAAQQAKTVLGYQAADVLKEMQRQGQRPGGSAPPMGSQPTTRPGPAPMTPMQPMPQPPMPQMHPQVPMPGRPPPPMAPSGTPASQARTVFIPGGAGPGPLPVQSAPISVPGPLGHPGSAPMHMPMSSAPSAPAAMPMGHPGSAPGHMPGYGGAPVPMSIGQSPSGPTAPPPYLASQTAARAARPIEPFADGLKLVLLAFGILLLGAFATPLTTEPTMTFHWNAIIDGPGMTKLLPLMLVTSGVLALVIALIPLSGLARGAFAALIGLFMIASPYIAAGSLGDWTKLVFLLGMLCLIAGLLIRHEYREAMLGRLLTTIGAVAVLAMYLIPVHGGDPPLIGMFSALGAVPLVEQKLAIVIALLPAVLAIVSLLCWLPAPSSAGAKILAWVWIVYPAVALLFDTFVRAGSSDLGDVIKASPFGALMAWVSSVAATAFIGYGVATVGGKQLE